MDTMMDIELYSAKGTHIKYGRTILPLNNGTYHAMVITELEHDDLLPVLKDHLFYIDVAKNAVRSRSRCVFLLADKDLTSFDHVTIAHDGTVTITRLASQALSEVPLELESIWQHVIFMPSSHSRRLDVLGDAFGRHIAIVRHANREVIREQSNFINKVINWALSPVETEASKKLEWALRRAKEAIVEFEAVPGGFLRQYEDLIHAQDINPRISLTPTKDDLNSKDYIDAYLDVVDQLILANERGLDNWQPNVFVRPSSLFRNLSQLGLDNGFHNGREAIRRMTTSLANDAHYKDGLKLAAERMLEHFSNYSAWASGPEHKYMDVIRPLLKSFIDGTPVGCDELATVDQAIRDNHLQI